MPEEQPSKRQSRSKRTGQFTWRWDKHPAWKITGAVAMFVFGAIAAVIGLATFMKTKSMTIEYMTRSPLVTNGADPAESITVAAKGVNLAKPSYLLLKISNSGDEPIKRADFDGPIVLPIVGARPVALEIAECKPKGVDWQGLISGNEVRLAPILMNRGDSVVLLILCDGLPEWPIPNVRVEGIPEPKILTPFTIAGLPPLARTVLASIWLMGTLVAFMMALALCVGIVKSMIYLRVGSEGSRLIKMPRNVLVWVAMLAGLMIAHYLVGEWLIVRLAMPEP